MRQFWQKWKAELGTTHPSRAPEKIAAKKRTRNDGRPPDTARQLLRKHSIDVDDVLDTSLSPTFEARTVIQGSDPSAPEDIVNVLFAQRESLRHDLVNKKIISAMDSFEAIFVCTNEISRVLTMSLTELLFHRHGWDPCSTIHVTVPSNSCMATSTFI
jgi:hypothetical protein